MNEIIQQSLAHAVGYEEYRNIISTLLAAGKSTGSSQSENLNQYTLLNETRMNRIEKTVTVSKENQQALQQIKSKYIWLIISEGWCGDSAQIVPIIAKMAEVTPNIKFQMVLRDANNALMDLFLTNGSRSIPKLIVLNRDFQVLDHWGPRPKGAVALMNRHLEEAGYISDEAKSQLQMWYLNDKGISTQLEIIRLMQHLDA